VRSLLFVPADSERKLEKSRGAGADGLILDLEDSVAADRRPAARQLARAFLTGARPADTVMTVRINPLAGDDALADLVGIMPGRPDAIVLPKATPAEFVRLDHYLAAFEAMIGIATGTTQIICIATETPAAIFQLGGFAGVSRRLAGLTWGAEDLGAALGAENRLADGSYDDTFRLARALCLLAAHAAGVPAIDTVFVDFRDEAGFAAECAAAARAGFTGKIAIHPAQIGPINAAFTPSEEQIVWARMVVDTFARNPDAGTIGVGGKMIDRPHLKLAQNLLARVSPAARAG